MARAIAAQSLEATGAALARSDFQAFSRRIRLPYFIGTETGATRIDTPEALRGVFDRAVENYTRLGITHLERTVSGAFFFAPDKVVAGHITLPFRNTTSCETPYPNHVVLQREGTEWKVSDGQYMVGGLAGQGRALVGNPAETGDAALKGMVDQVLGGFATAQLTGDFDALMRCVHLPLILHGPHSLTLVETLAELREGFEQRRLMFRLRGVTDIVRQVKSAVTAGEDRIFGVVRTHVLSGTALVVPAYDTACILRLGRDGAWRLCAAGNAGTQHFLTQRHVMPGAQTDATVTGPVLFDTPEPEGRDAH